jgi:uncharacterized protein (TIGR00255 family)
VRSMTGFGEGCATSAAGTAKVAISTVNHKTISIQIRGDLRDLAVEERIREQVRAKLVRGSATVQVSWEPAGVAILDQSRVAAVWRELAALAAQLGAPPPSLAEAVSLVGRMHDDPAVAIGPVCIAVDQALERLDASRRCEGAALQAALHGMAAGMRRAQARMLPLAAARLPLLRERLLGVVSDAVGRAVPPEVLAREIAIEAQRIDISEELIRLAAHLDALDRLLAREDQVGRELDFLAQELGREANTSAAKANHAGLSELCVELKVAIDQLKEQSANCL